MSATSIDIRVNQPGERDAILAFVKEMGFNPRDAVTWDALGMVAMTAWQDGRLIGAIPLEPRPLRINADLSVKAAHETVVAVHPDFRRKGIGSAMQEAIFKRPPEGARLLSVFREEPDSPAYRWYLKNGFRSAIHVDSWFHNGQQNNPGKPRIEFYDLPDPTVPWELLDEVWTTSRRGGGGFVDRSQRTLKDWLDVHPYRARYRFDVAIQRGNGGGQPGYALYGTGSMHSQGERIDILELISAGGQAELGDLLDGVLGHSARLGCLPVRWPLAALDPSIEVAKRAGFDKKWGFDMLVRLCDDGIDLDPATISQWRYAGLDYI